jgi:excisionase family DNA binding protein
MPHAPAIPGPTTQPRVLRTVKEAAAQLAVSRSTVYQLMSDSSLTYVKIGRSRRVPRTPSTI